MVQVMLPYRFVWRNNSRRAQLYNRHCRIVTRGRMNTILVEFEDGTRVTTSGNALRKIALVPESTAGEHGGGAT